MKAEPSLSFPASGTGREAGTCEFTKELALVNPDLSSSGGREFVVSRKKIAVVSSTPSSSTSLSSTPGRRTQARRRLDLVAAAASLGFGFLSGISTPAAASYHRHYRAYGYATGDLGSPSHVGHRSHRRSGTEEASKPEPPKQPSGPLLLAISIGNQKVTVYDNGSPVAVSSVSTGMPGHPTPMGVFSVIQKQRWHHSNIYSGAPMPYMQRITWSGVALHAGVVPGHPASHGCIRLPERFAVRLWGMTKVGARVIITRGDAAPYEITHPRLAGLVKASEAALNADASASKEQSSAGPAGSAVKVAATTTGTVTAGGAEASHDGSAPSVSDVGASASPPVEGGAADKPAETGQPAEPAPVERTPAQKIDDALQQHPGPISLFISRRLGKLFVRKGFAPVFEVPVTIARPEVPLGTHVFTASRPMNEGGEVRWLAVSISDRTGSAPAPAKRKARGGRERDERPMPLTTDASRQAAVEALDRIELPPEALEHIIPLIAPGASLVISDQGLGSETGRDTDFIVVTK
jgi:hypothetical protein